MSFKIDYLFNVLFRSSKFISILFGTILFKSHGHTNINKKDLLWGVILTVGVFIFHLGSETKKDTLSSFEGFLFGFLSLLADSFVSHF